MLKGYFDNLPGEIEDAARIDGCGLFQLLTRIVLPVAAPGVLVAAFYSFVVSWGDYPAVSVISQSQSTATLTLALQRLGGALILRWAVTGAARPRPCRTRRSAAAGRRASGTVRSRGRRPLPARPRG